MHFLTLSWDDGFQKSPLKTAEIFEKFGLRTEFNFGTGILVAGSGARLSDERRCDQSLAI